MTTLHPSVDRYLKLVADSSAEPVSTSDIVRHCRLPSTDTGDNTWIADAITAARKIVEARIPGGRALVNQTWDMVLSRFPPSAERLEFPRPPLVSGSTNIVVTYYDAGNSSTVLASTNYVIHGPYDQPGYITPRPTDTWPSTYRREDAVNVRFVAGYGSAGTNVPMPLRHAIKMLVGHWYEHRETVLVGSISKEIELAFDSLLQSADWGCYS